MISKRMCPICLKSNTEILHELDVVLPIESFMPSHLTIVCCSYCGMVYSDTIATQEDYNRYYRECSIYEDPKTSIGSGILPHDRCHLQQIAQRIAKFADIKSARVLDIGCASGGSLMALTEIGFKNPCGIDPSPACVKAGQNIKGAHIYQGSIHSMPDLSGLFDVVILSHVLEHVYDVLAGVDAALSQLKPGGHLYVEVPDACRFHDYISAPFQDFNIEHINYFSPQSLDNLFSYTSHRVAHELTELQLTDDILYPAFYSIYEYSCNPNMVLYDHELHTKIDLYIQKSLKEYKQISELIKTVCNSGPVIIWGTGQLTYKLLADTALRNANIIAFIDSNPSKHGNTLHGVPIQSPLDLKMLPNCPIIIASLIHHHQISAALTNLGVTNTQVMLK
jgi:SAM-dependent methyltransferase